MNTTQANTTHESSTPEYSPIPLTGSWFGRYGMTPYTVLGLCKPSPVAPDEFAERNADAA